MISLMINDTDYSEYVSSLSTSSKASKNSIIGNVTSKELKVLLDNSNEEFESALLESKFILKDEEKSLGVFNVLDKPERMTSELSITAYDNVILTGKPFNSQLDYDSGTVTVRTILDEISGIIGVSIDYSQLDSSVLNRIVKNYDNSVTIRDHLSMIAEIGCANVYANGEGIIVFKVINKNILHYLDENDVEYFEKIEDFNCTKVSFENGVIEPLSNGDDSGNTVYISEDNMFIDNQEQIDYIYSLINGLSFKSVKDFKNVEIKGIEIGDIVNYADEFKFIALEIETTYINAEYNIQTIYGTVSTKKASTVENNASNSKISIRRLKTKIDQNEATMEIIAQQSSNNADEIGKLLVSNDEIRTEVKKKVGEDEIISKINQSAEAIKILAKYIQLEGIITANGNITIHEDGSLEAKNGKFTGKVEGSSFSTAKTTEYTYTENDKTIVQNLIMDESPPTAEQLAKYDLDLNGLITARDYVRMVNILNGKYGDTGGKATFVDKIAINLEGSGKIVTERYLNGTRVEYMEFNAGSIVKSGDGSIMINGEPVITEISGTIARFG